MSEEPTQKINQFIDAFTTLQRGLEFRVHISNTFVSSKMLGVCTLLGKSAIMIQNIFSYPCSRT